ncbi:MAG TPA: hypothetical protein VNO30_45250 [Kofleriaceae bacterium]|nr:hypothetical protein [Kofleriaceae bacterium]
MDQPHKHPHSAAFAHAEDAHEEAVTFSTAEYAADPRKVIAHAEATGCAVVVGADGCPQVVITIPIADLPTLDY